MSTRRLTVEGWTHPEGERFKVLRWRGEAPAEALLLIHHGLGEHAGRYHRLAQGLGDLPLEVAAYDLRGHGATDGPRGHAAGLDQLADDLERLIPELLDRAGVDRLFLLGHSMGAAVVVHWLVSAAPPEALAGVLISGAALQIARTPDVAIKLALGRLIRGLSPSFALGNGLDPRDISHLREEVRRYRTDPLVHDRISASLGLSLVEDAARALERADRITHPILIWHGEDDAIANADDARALFEKVGSEDKTLEVFSGLFHEVHNEDEPARAQLDELLTGWLGARL